VLSPRAPLPARAAFQRALAVDGTYGPAQQNLQKMNGGA
jgi:hypothetical protein